MYKKISIFLLLIIIFVLSFSLISCEQKNSDTNNYIEPEAPEKFTYTIIKNKYDLGNEYVKINLTIKSEYLGRELSSDNPPKYINLYWSSFGDRHFITTIKDFSDFNSQIFVYNIESAVLYDDVFVNDYGAIKLQYSIEKNEFKDTYGCLYYKKNNGTIYLSKTDLLNSAYHDYYNLYKLVPTYIDSAKNVNIDNEICSYKGFLNKKFQDNYIAYIANPRYFCEAKDEEMTLKVFVGHILEENEKPLPQKVNVYVERIENGIMNKYLLKSINDYNSDVYGCTRSYDYYKNIKEIIFDYSFDVIIPREYYDWEDGSFNISIYSVDDGYQGQYVSLASVSVSYITLHNRMLSNVYTTPYDDSGVDYKYIE